MALTSPAFGTTQAQAIADAYAAQFGAPLDFLHAQTGEGAQQVESLPI